MRELQPAADRAGVLILAGNARIAAGLDRFPVAHGLSLLRPSYR